MEWRTFSQVERQQEPHSGVLDAYEWEGKKV